MAQNYPTRPVRIVVSFAAGASPDITARILAQWLSERLGQQFIIDNRPGAGTNVGTEAAVKAKADGYTLLWLSAANTISRSLYANLQFDVLRDIEPVGGFVSVPLVMLVSSAVPTATIQEFIAYAKANPGELNMASSEGLRHAWYWPSAKIFGGAKKNVLSVRLLTWTVQWSG